MQIYLTRQEERKLKRAIRRAKENLKLALAVAYFIAALIICGRIDHYYKIEAEITDLDGYTYTAVDVAGYEWKFEDDTLFPVGTNVKLKMFNHLTHSSRVDDEIIKVTPMK